jgi:hypothetical protein
MKTGFFPVNADSAVTAGVTAGGATAKGDPADKGQRFGGRPLWLHPEFSDMCLVRMDAGADAAVSIVAHHPRSLNAAECKPAVGSSLLDIRPVRHCHVNLARTACGRGLLRGGGYAAVGRSFLVPHTGGVGLDFAIGTGFQLMSAGTEMAANEGVGGEEVLGLPRRFESLHLPLSSSRGSV